MKTKPLSRASEGEFSITLRAVVEVSWKLAENTKFTYYSPIHRISFHYQHAFLWQYPGGYERSAMVPRVQNKSKEAKRQSFHERTFKRIKTQVAVANDQKEGKVISLGLTLSKQLGKNSQRNWSEVTLAIRIKCSLLPNRPDHTAVKSQP